MATTTSVHIGDCLNKAEELNHNNFRDNRDNIDHERTKDNVILCDRWNFSKSERENLRDFLKTEVCSNGKTIEENLEAWNSTKKKSRDKKTLDDLLNKQVIRKEKGKEQKQYALRQHGIIFQVGGEEAGQIDPELAKEILIDMFDRFCEMTRGKVIITSAAIHMDEKTPHLHIDYLPISFDPGKSRGVPFEFSPHKIYEQFCDPEILEASKSLDLRTRQNKIFSSVHDRFDDALIDICNEWSIEIKNPERTGIKHKNQNIYRMEEEVRKDLERKEQDLQQKTDRWETMATKFFEGKKQEYERQAGERENEFREAVSTASKRLKTKEKELAIKSYDLSQEQQAIDSQKQQIVNHWETIDKDRKELNEQKQEFDIELKNYRWDKEFGENYWQQFEGDPMVCPSDNIQEIIEATDKTRLSLLELLKRQPALLEELPKDLAEHCETGLRTELEKEREREEPELEQSLGGLFD